MENETVPVDLSLRTNLDTNTISSPGCFVQKGKINCSTDIYKDKKTWRRSRNRIENEIQELKHKLETLKEIRRHLKNTRPLDEMANLNGTELNAFNELNFEQSSLPIHLANEDSLPRPMFVDNGNRLNKKKRKRPTQEFEGI